MLQDIQMIAYYLSLWLVEEIKLINMLTIINISV